MSIAEKAGNINGAIQAFVQKGLETAETFHHMTAELPVDLAQQAGLGKSKADLIKDTHRRMLGRFYGAVADVGRQMGDLLVTQTTDAEELVISLSREDSTGAAGAPDAVSKHGKKAAAKTADGRKKNEEEVGQ